MLFLVIQQLLIEPFSLDTQRQIFGLSFYGLGDFRKPTIQVQHDATEMAELDL